MASEFDERQHIGVLLHDERVTLANLAPNTGAVGGGSEYTESTPRPGVPVYNRDAVATGMTPTRGPLAGLDALGDQDGATSYTIKAVEPGMPGQRAQMVYRPSLDGVQKWRGCNTPNVLEWFLQDSHIEVSTAVAGATKIGSCRTSNDRVCWVYVKSTDLVEAVVYDPEAHTLGAPVTVANFAADPNDDEASMPEPTPCVDVIQGADGRLLAYYLTRQVDPVAASTVRLGWSYSDDNGANWRTGGVHIVDTRVPNTWPTTTPFTRLRAAHHGGQVLILLHWQPQYEDPGEQSAQVDVWLQLASDDAGATFQLVDSGLDHVTGTNPNAGPQQIRSEIVIDRATGIYSVVYERAPAGGGSRTIDVKRIASPFDTLANVSGSTIRTITGLPITDLAAWDDENGRINVVDIDGNTSEQYYTRDGGVTWHEYGFNAATSQIASTIFNRLSIAEAGGRAVWAVCDETTAYPSGNRYLILGSGGWCTVEQPRGSRTIDDYPQNAGWGEFAGAGIAGNTWYPPRLPTTQNWTGNGAGAELMTAPSPWEVVLTTTVNARSYSKVSPVRRVTWQLKLDTAGTTLSTKVGIRLSATNFDLSVRFKSDTIAIFDEVGVPAQRATVTVDTTVARVYLLGVGWQSGTAYAVLYSRLPASDDYSAILVSSWASAAASGPGNLIEWGNIATGTEVSRWGYFHHSEFAGDTGNRDALWRRDITTHAPLTFTGAPIPAPPYRAYVDQGLKLVGSSGPFVVGDTWDIEPFSDYPVDVIIPEVSGSPRRVTRTTGTASTVYTWTLEGGTDTALGDSSYGLAVFGINWRTGRLRGWDGAAWTTIVDLDAAIDLGQCSYTRTGNRVTVNAAASPFRPGGRWIHYNEFAGSTIDLGAGKLRRIRSNTEGAWTTATTKLPTFLLEGVDGTEPASGDCAIWSRSAVGLAHDNTATYQRFALEILSHNTVDGYFETGSAILGPVVFFGQRYSWGRNQTLEQALTLSETRDGHRRVRQDAPERRVISAAWTEGVNTGTIDGASPDPRYIAMKTGGLPVAALGDQPTIVEGLTRRLSGRLGVLCARIDDAPVGDVTQMAGRERYVLGRMLANVETSVNVGDEHRDELVVISGLQWSEEV